MKHQYLEVTFRRGKPIAAYLYLPRVAGTKAARTSDEGNGLRADFDVAGNPIGIEITAPRVVDLAAVNQLLTRLGAAPMPVDEWAPLRAA